MANLPYEGRELFWLGSTKETVSGFPVAAKRLIGFGLRLIQNGPTPVFAAPLRDMGSGVFELKVDSGKDTYRVVYIAKLPPGVFVLHAFMKKSRTGRSLPREVKSTILSRLSTAREMARVADR
jgi:phage-related protein